MTYQKPIVLTVIALCLCVTGWCQLGLRLRQIANDTLIRDKSGYSEGFKPIININNFYRLHVGAAYRFTTGAEEDTTSLKNQHKIGLNYSLSEKSFHPYYKAIFPQLINGWNLSLLAGYDQVRRVNFFGVGNESPRIAENNEFNWLRTQNLYSSIGVDRTFDRHHLGLNLTYDGIRVMDDEDRIVARAKGLVEEAQYNRQTYLGSQLLYSYTVLNQPMIPTKGVEFAASAGYTENMERRDRSFARFTTDVDYYVPLLKKISLALKSGFATMTGKPDFYQLNNIGGSNTLRGFQRFRFYGKTSFYNQNELRWISDVKTKLYQGQFGIFALLDQGRVWHPGEESGKMHVGYGGGLILAPFNKVAITAAYAISNEDRRMHISIRRFFK